MSASRALEDRLAVCSWSLQPPGPRELIAGLQAAGISRVQLGLDPLRESPSVWGNVQELCREAGITIISGMAGCLGEDYTTLESIRRTGGVVRDETWAENLANFKTTAETAKRMGLKFVAFHAGFVPHDENDPGYAKMVDRLTQIAKIFAAQGIDLGLETGQETAADLLKLLVRLGQPNLGVNFDPANMILYAKGDPVEAVRLLLPHVWQIHVKDANRTLTPGTWGEEVVVGTGQVDWRAFFEVLDGGGFQGDLVIEREAGNQRVADIRSGRAFLETIGVGTAGAGSTDAKPTRRVNVAVVGLGFMGVTHLRAYLALPTARVVAVCDAVRLPVNGILAGVAGNVAKSDDINLGAQVKVYRKLEEVLADPEVELVDLCTPTPFHAEQAIAALKAGKHVFCEKPMARTSVSAREIVQAANASPGFLMPAMCMRFWPGWSWLKQAVKAGTYGKVLAARFRRVSAMPTWSKQGTYTQDLGGALFDLHIHDTDFVNFLFGRPDRVFSAGVLSAAGSADHVVTQYLYDAGPAVTAEGGWLLASGFNMAYTLLCEKATLDFDLARGTAAMQILEQGQAPRTVTYDDPDGYMGEIRYLLECLAAGRAPEVVTAQDGLTALQICEAEEQSLRTGQVVEVAK